ncbi:aldo/keto reductase [Fictibacillus barbaricus]|uniref:Aldo/keto reductase n=1 Tax=Fictibacillus barbaricus TaxID=182136 RepID=A0ABS2ZBQ1_9BACL|nr:aldo/keto reductase [Fictibacillus barbaricus]MBN3544738.1 aldo/keto reductase [Fictibacillus barbaricus]GGB64384.1 glyoxal reductase [Fictibacillus barbaricus]
MASSSHDRAVLHNGVQMPWVGLGVYKAEDGDEVIQAIKWAIDAGYRSIDTASLYENEAGVGQAIAESHVPREELFITTKVWNTDQGYERTLEAFNASLERLGLDYVDLYLVHWPVPEMYKETWKALEKIYNDGRAKAIGVSNFKKHHLEDLIADAEIKPMVNQVEYHPRLTQEDLLSYCKEKGIQLEAWRPLLKGEIFEEPTLVELAEKYNKSVAQIILRWDLQNGVVTIPKSVTKNRIEENIDIFDFELTNKDMSRISALNQDKRNGADPDDPEFYKQFD